ncbi:MAG: hypothetical protein ACFCU6_03850, partial [Balneolaceae bacterium]
KINWITGANLELIGNPVAINEPDNVIKAALKSPDVQGKLNWIRFPYYEVQLLKDGYRVIIRDLRYVRHDQTETSGVGITVVTLDNNLEVR